MTIRPTSSVPYFLDAIGDLLAARAVDEDSPLHGVEIATAPLGDESARESIQFGDVNGETPWGALAARRRDEGYNAGGLIWVQASGKGEMVIRAARDRAYALWGEIEEAIVADPNLGGTVHKISFGPQQLEQGPGKGWRWAQLNFTLKVEAILRPA